ncbi:MAG: AAA family ATPase [Oscillospiraceae bacterium]
MKKRVITISRQFGSRGHSIGEEVAKHLGIAYYDKEILNQIAADTGFSAEFIEKTSEYASSNNSLLWNLAVNRRTDCIQEENPSDVIYFAQAKIIEKLAEDESCVIVGRCSDYILRDRKDCLHIFICADKDSRAKWIIERYGENHTSVERRIEDKDTRRRLYYSHYTDRVWGAPENYHVILNSGLLGIDACVSTIVDLFAKDN